MPEILWDIPPLLGPQVLFRSLEKELFDDSRRCNDDDLNDSQNEGFEGQRMPREIGKKREEVENATTSIPIHSVK